MTTMLNIETHDIDRLNAFSTNLPNKKFAENQYLYTEVDKDEQPQAIITPIDEDDGVMALIAALFSSDTVEQSRMSMMVRGRKSIKSDEWVCAQDSMGRVRRKNARNPGQRIGDLFASSSFAFCGAYEEFAYFTDGTHIVSVKNMPSAQFDQARNGLLLKNVTMLASTPASRDTFKAAKVSASKSVIKAKDLYVIDTERCHESVFVMTSKKDENEMFLPSGRGVAAVKERLARRIDQRERQAEIEAQKAAEAEAERIRAEQEVWSVTVCIRCAVTKGEHDYCRACRRVTCAREFVNCRRCGKLIGCVKCSEHTAVRSRSGALYCNRKESEAAEPTVRRYAARANQRRSGGYRRTA